MMRDKANQLELRAKRAYETARLYSSLNVLVYVLPLVLLSGFACGSWLATLFFGAFMAVAAVGFLWRGQGLGRGVIPGLIAGSLAFLFPFIAHRTELCCRYDIEMAICVFVGLLSGLWLGRLSLRTQNPQLLLSGGTIVVLAGALGCGTLGVSAVAGVGMGILLTTLPAAWVLQRQMQT